MKKVLIVDNCLRLWNELVKEFGETIDKSFISDTKQSEIYKEGFMQLKNNNVELYITPELQTSKKLIETNYFNIYFLDNQIYDISSSEKILGQKQLVNIIKDKSSDKSPIIYNISSHENTNGLARCPKQGRDIMNIIMDGKYEK